MSGCSAASGVYFRTCLEHAGQLGPSVCREPEASGSAHQQTPSSRVSGAGRWGQDGCKAPAIWFPSLAPSRRSASHVLWTPVGLLRVAAFEGSAFTTCEKRISSDLGGAGTGPWLPVHWGTRRLSGLVCAHDLRSIWTVNRALISRRLTG